MVGLRRSRRRIVRFAPGMSTDAESLCLLLRPSRWYVVRASGDGRGQVVKVAFRSAKECTKPENPLSLQVLLPIQVARPRASGDGRGKSNLARVPSRSRSCPPDGTRTPADIKSQPASRARAARSGQTNSTTDPGGPPGPTGRPTWPGLSETGNGRGTTPNLCDSAGSGRARENSHRNSQPTTHVARSLRDREWDWNNAARRPFLQISNAYRDLPKATQSGGMERSECESRRDLPTWLGLSETENGIGTTPHAGHSYRYRTRIETCRKLLNPAEWNGPNASLGETRPRGPVSPRPGMGLEQRRAPAIPLDPEPSLPRIPTRLPRRSGPEWTSLLEFRSRRAARTYKAPERFRGVLFLKLFLKRRLTCPTSVY